jgi:hypothetical protein
MQSLSDCANSQPHMQSRITWDCKHLLALQGHHNNTLPTLSERPTFPHSRWSRTNHVIASTNLVSRDNFLSKNPFSNIGTAVAALHVLRLACNVPFLVSHMSVKWADSTTAVPGVMIIVQSPPATDLPAVDLPAMDLPATCQVCSVINFHREYAQQYSPNWLLPTSILQTDYCPTIFSNWLLPNNILQTDYCPHTRLSLLGTQQMCLHKISWRITISLTSWMHLYSTVHCTICTVQCTAPYK